MSQQKKGNTNPSENENPSTSAVRTEFHALSNALEIIVQSSYLLTTTCTDENSKKWLEMLNQGVDRAVTAQRALRSSLTMSGDHPPSKE